MLLAAALFCAIACSQAPVVPTGPPLGVTVVRRAPTCTTASCPISIGIHNLQRQRLAVTQTLYYEGSWVYLWIKRDDSIEVMPYPVP